MQDSYTGDIGDYFKLALLRALTRDDHRLGVGWYRMPDESRRNDGRHVGYLGLDVHGATVMPAAAAAKWRALDPELYDGLRTIVAGGSRRIAALTPLLPAGTTLHDVRVPRSDREQWFATLRDGFDDRTLIFVDPDNGIEPGGFKAGSAKAGKSVTLAEIRSLGTTVRNLVIYHHHTRFAGGHVKEIETIGARLATLGLGGVAAIRAKSFSPRVFFLLVADRDLWRRAEKFAARRPDVLEFHAIDGPPDPLGLPPSSPYGDRAEAGLIAFGKRVDAGEHDRFLKRGQWREV